MRGAEGRGGGWPPRGVQGCPHGLRLPEEEAGAAAGTGLGSLEASFGAGDPGARLGALGDGRGTPELGRRPALRPHLPPGPEDGVVRTSGPLDLARAGAALTTLQVRAFERLRPGASVQLDLTVNVTPVNRWPPHCLPALLL